jgi:hypothetical protein
MLYNGLKDDLNTFSKFVYIYETKIKFIRKVNDFLMVSREASYLFKHNIQPKVKYATKYEIASLADFSKQTLFFTASSVQIIDFCRHLRNSFVHALLEKKDNKFYITDKSRNKETCKGFLDYTLVKEFVIQIVKDYELKTK